MSHATLDTLFTGIAALAGTGIFALLWYVVRLLSVQRDFSPHRHEPPYRTPGVIIYPKGMSPE